MENPADTWWLKTPDGEQYGPVTLATLQQWAETGRVTPGALLSPNQEKWKPAHLLDVLLMNCVVRVGPSSFYGPIHANAVDIYTRDGIIPQNATVYTSRGNTPGHASKPLESSLLDAQAKRHLAALQDSEKHLATALAEHEATRRRAAETEANLHAAGAEIQRLTSALADAQTLHADAEARHTDAVEKLEAARRETDGMRVELDLLRDKQASTGAALSQFRATIRDLAAKLNDAADNAALPLSGQEAAAPLPIVPTVLDGGTFDPAAPVVDSPLARLEAQARLELAKLQDSPAQPAFPGLFKKNTRK